MLLPTILEEQKADLNSILIQSLCWCLFQVVVFLNGKRIFALGAKGQLSRYMASKVRHLLWHFVEADHFPL